MFLNVLSSSTQSALEKLDSSSFFIKTSAYLAGGTALALHIGHRLSIDLDFFTPENFSEDLLVNLLKDIGDLKVDRVDWQTIIGTFEDVKFSLFLYQYPLLKTPEILLTKSRVASPQDLAAMKVGAIARRGTKRDFIDLYFLTRIFPLEKSFDFYNQKYRDLASQRTHILKSLIYFADADPNPMPQMIKKITWEEVRNFFVEEIKRLAADLV